MAIGKSIKIKLPEGNLDGSIEISLVNWPGIAYRIRRDKISAYKSNERLKQSGVYFLYGETKNSQGETIKHVYIGQGGKRKNGQGVLARILDHDKSKQSFWSEAVVFVDKEDSFGKTELCFLENQFTNKAISAKQKSSKYKIQNGNDPNIGNVTDDKQWELEEYINGAVLILESLRYDFFHIEDERKTVVSPASGENASAGTFALTKDQESSKSNNLSVADDFISYLRLTIHNKKTLNCYISNFKRLDSWLKENHLLKENSSMFHLPCDEALIFTKNLLKNPAFSSWNRARHNNFSAVLGYFIKYIQGQHTVTAEIVEQNKLPKIGKICRLVLRPLLSEGRFSDRDIKFLLSEESGKTFKTDSGRPLLALSSEKALIYDSKHRARYSPTPFLANGKKVHMYTQLRDRCLVGMLHFLEQRGITRDEILKRCAEK